VYIYIYIYIYIFVVVVGRASKQSRMYHHFYTHGPRIIIIISPASAVHSELTCDT